MLEFNHQYLPVMKSKVFFLPLFVLVLLQSCSSSKNVNWYNLPRAGTNKALANQRGALVVDPDNSNKFDDLLGELLFVSESGTITLESKEGILVEYTPKEYSGFNMHPYRPAITTAGWSVPLSPLKIFIHGWFVGISAPVAWITSALNLSSERRAYKVSMKGINAEVLRAHSRFPMGIPSDYRPHIFK